MLRGRQHWPLASALNLPLVPISKGGTDTKTIVSGPTVPKAGPTCRNPRYGLAPHLASSRTFGAHRHKAHSVLSTARGEVCQRRILSTTLLSANEESCALEAFSPSLQLGLQEIA